MTPELPIELPPGITLTELSTDLACCMLRNESRCNNAARYAIIYPTGSRYGMLVFCQFCFDMRADGWMEALEVMSYDR